MKKIEKEEILIAINHINVVLNIEKKKINSLKNLVENPAKSFSVLYNRVSYLEFAVEVLNKLLKGK